MQRRDFLKRLTMTTAGLLVADDALALLVEPRRKIWPVGVNLRPGPRAEWSDDAGVTWRRIALHSDGWQHWTAAPIRGVRPDTQVLFRASGFDGTVVISEMYERD